MSWAKLCDGFWRNAKVLSCEPATIGFFACCISYCAGELNDGRIPKRQLHRVMDTDAGRKVNVKRACSQLVSAGLMEELGDCVGVRNWLKYNPSRSQVQSRRASTLVRVTRYNAKKAAEAAALANSAQIDQNVNAVNNAGLSGVPVPVPEPIKIKNEDLLGCAQVGYESSRAPAHHRVAPARCDLAFEPDLPAKTGVPPDLPAATAPRVKSAQDQATPEPRQQAQTTTLVVAPRVGHKNVIDRTPGASESMSEPEIVVSDAVGLAFMHERVANDYKLGVPGTLFWKQDKTLEKAGRTLNREEVDRAWQNAKAFSYNQNRPLKLNTFLRNLEFVMEDKQAEATMPSRRVANQVNSPSGDGMTWKQRKQLKEDQDFCKWAQSLEDAEEIQNSQAVSQ